jgi:hypothetical protein
MGTNNYKKRGLRSQPGGSPLHPKNPVEFNCANLPYAQKPGFCAGIGDEPQGSFQKPGFSSFLRQS